MVGRRFPNGEYTITNRSRLFFLKKSHASGGGEVGDQGELGKRLASALSRHDKGSIARGEPLGGGRTNCCIDAQIQLRTLMEQLICRLGRGMKLGARETKLKKN